jgi:hypothetical protein
MIWGRWGEKRVTSWWSGCEDCVGCHCSCLHFSSF